MIPAMLANFIYFINEREAIRLRKASGIKAPWTKDRHLAEWRFCNVNRCDDRETRWIFKNIIAEYATSETLWFNLAIARFINWSPSLAMIGYFHDWSADVFNSGMLYLTLGQSKVYTGAYMIRAGTGEDAKLPKHEYLAKRVFGPLWDRREERPGDGATCADWDVFLRGTFGMGDFMRNQIITDYKYSAILRKAKTADWKTFVLAGPGTNRGLNRLHGVDINHLWKPLDAAEAIATLRTRVAPKWKGDNATFDDLNNLSNCLCEFDKYRRLEEGEGQPRSRYQPHSEKLP